jgi:hypothetical protein
MTDKELFTEYFRCKIEPTNRVAYLRPIGVVQLGASNNPNIEVTEEKVMAIYLPETMLNDLIEIHANLIKDSEVRHRDPRVMQLYSQYITLARLVR